jgi:hypothetical protein
MTLEIEGDDILMDRTAGRVRSDADQQRMYPTGGGGFHLVAQATGQGGVVHWGSETPAMTVSSGGNVWQNTVNTVLAGERS